MGSRTLRALLVLVVAGAAGTFARAGTTHAFPPTGTDVIPLTAQASVTSRLGQETIQLTGTATIERGEPYLDNGVSVIDLEIVALDLTGDSVTGPVTVAESAAGVSTGEIRSQQAGADYPADLYLNGYVTLEAPASPSPTITLYNSTALHLVPMLGTTQVPIGSWPPYNVPLKANTTPCVPLLPSNPKEACVTSLTVTFGSTGGGGVGGVTEVVELDAAGTGGSAPWLLLASIAAGAVVVAAGATGWRRRAR